MKSNYRLFSAWMFALGIALIHLGWTQPCRAQNIPAQGSPGMNKIQSLKIAFLTERINLTPQEAKAFWPLYDAYQNEMKELIKARRQQSLDRIQLDAATDQEVDAALRADYQYQKEALDLRYAYEQKYLKVIPARKVVLLFRAEKAFNMQLFNELKARRQMHALGNSTQ